MRRGLRRHWMTSRRRGGAAALAVSGRQGPAGHPGPSAASRLGRGLGRRRGRSAAACGGLLTIALAAAGCGLAGASSQGTRPVSGGTATYALPPDTQINYIFPFTPGNDFSVVNSSNLQYLMYRPLYWFGGSNGTPVLNEALSLAYRPRYHGRQVTIRLKHYQWTNGEKVTATDVVFWMNMMKAVGTKDWGGYVPNEFPTNVAAVHAVGRYEIRMDITGRYSPEWFTDNELSQITPMPLAWDQTASGPGSCATQYTACPAVYQYLNSKAKSPPSWPTSPLWKVVDGPWRLTSYDTQGVLTFTYNKDYSGPVAKHHITTFKEVPFTSEQAEFDVLQAGGANTIDVGYMPTVDAPVPPPSKNVGGNPIPGYRLQALYAWGLSYFPYNFGSNDPQRAVVSQLYIRRAIQLVENQSAIIQGPLHGYGKVTTGPVGSYPVTSYLSPRARKGDPYPYNPSAASKLLTSHGWAVKPGSASVCVRPGTGAGECGAGIAAGTKLVLTLDYADGVDWIQSALLALQSNASELGIQVELRGMPFDSVTNLFSPVGCNGKPCQWELADWGLGWSYVPDYLPTGDELFMTGAAANFGGYTNATDDEYIARTLHQYSRVAMWNWQNYLTQQLPVVFQPNAPYELVETIDNLHVGTFSSTLDITPEDWYFLR